MARWTSCLAVAAMNPSPESIIFSAVQNAGRGRAGPGGAGGQARSNEESAELTNAVLSALHTAGYRIVRRDGRDD